MSLSSRKMLTIVVEASIERVVVRDLERAGVTGFTAVEARGFGQHGRREGDWDQSRSVRIETICEEAKALELAHGLLERFGRDYAIVLWLQEVEVLRGSKFDADGGGLRPSK